MRSFIPVAVLTVLVLNFASPAKSHAADFGSQTIAKQDYSATAPFSLTLPAVSTGTDSTSYALVLGDLSLATFDSDNRVLSGTETATSDSMLTYTATDGDGSDSLIFRVVVHAAPAFPDGASISDQITVINDNELSVDIFEATVSLGTLTYTLYDAHGNFVRFRDSPRPLSHRLSAFVLGSFGRLRLGIRGTDASLGTHDMTYRATDRNGAFVEVYFRATIYDSLEFENQESVQTEFRVGIGEAIELTLPAVRANSGAPPVLTTISALPTGLSFDDNTRVVSGAFATAGARQLTWRAADSVSSRSQLTAGQTASLVFRWTASETVRFAAGTTIPDITYTAGLNPDTAVTEFRLNLPLPVDGRSAGGGLNASGSTTLHGDAFVLSSLRPDSQRGRHGVFSHMDSAFSPLPAGLDFFISNSNAINGALAVYIRHRSTSDAGPNGEYLMTYTVTDIDDQSAQLFFKVISNDPLRATNLQNQTWSRGVPIHFTLPRAHFQSEPFADRRTGSPPLTYRFSQSSTNLDPAPLPFGLTLDPVAGVLSGRLTASTPNRNDMYMNILDTNGAFRGDHWVLNVVNRPSFGGATVADQSYTVGHPVEPLTLPNATAPAGGLSFTLSDVSALDWLIYGENSGVHTLSGTPDSVAGAPLDVVWTALDKNQAPDSLTFTIDVFAALTFTATQQLANLTLPLNIASETELPAVTGGRPTLIYTLLGDGGTAGTPNLPAGLSFDPMTRMLSGTASTEDTTSGAPLAYTATDANGVAAEQEIRVFVFPPPSFTDDDVSLTFTARQTGIDLTFPEATNGVSYAFDLSGGAVLPAGLDLDQTNRVLSGVPSAAHAAGATSVIVMTATGAGGFFATHTTTIVVLAAPRLVAGAAIADQTYAVNSPITEQTLPLAVADTGYAPLSFTLTESSGGGLPADLTFEPGDVAANTAPRLSGTPLPGTEQSDTEYVYALMDANGVSAALTFTITINPPLGFPDIQGDLSFTAGHQSTFTLLEAVGGLEPRSYTLVPGLGAEGLVFDPDMRTLAGAPSAEATFAMTYTVEDSAPTPVSEALSFDVVVVAAVDFDTATVAEQSYTVNTPITALTLPSSATGGVGDLAYAITDFDGLGGLMVEESDSGGVDVYTLTGMPTSAAGTHNLVWSATDLNGAADEVTFLVTVFAAPVFDRQQGDLAFAKDVESNFTLPAVTGGRPDITFELNGQETFVDVLPGLDFDGNANPPTLGGAATAANAGVAVTFSATDANGARIERIFMVEVVDRPTFPTNTLDLTYTVGKSVDYTLPRAIGGLGMLAYAITYGGEDLSALGLSLDPASLVLSGATPVAQGAAATIEIVANPPTGEGSLPLVVTVRVVPAPDFARAVGDLAYTQDVEITPLSLPVAMSGTGAEPLGYVLEPNPPSGLAYSANSGTESDPPTLSGTPTAMAAAAQYTYTVTDNNEAVDTLVFDITVNEPLTFTGTQGDLSYTAGHLSEFTLPAADGGTGSRSYTLEPSSTLSGAGFGFDGDTLVLRGTPTGSGGNTIEVSYTVTDTATTQASVTQVFDLVIAPAVSFDPSAAVVEQSYTSNEPITALTLPTNAMGGVGDLSFAITDIGGLTGTGESRTGDVYTLTGKPETSVAAGVYNVVWSAIDANGATGDLTIAVRVFDAPVFTATPGDLVFALSFTSTLTLPEVTGGRPEITFQLSGMETLSGVLPGLDFDGSAEPRTLSGAPSEENESGTEVIYAAIDANGVRIEQTLNLKVVARPAFPMSTLELTYTDGKDVNYILPAADGGAGAKTYDFTYGGGRTLSGLGLSLVEASRVLSGTPSVHSDTAMITYTATDTNNQSSEPLVVTVRVVPAPSFAGGVSDLSFTQDFLITTQNLPVVVGGTGAAPLDYALEPNLPSGLAYAANGGTAGDPPTLSGTPDAMAAQDEYTYTVTDNNGVVDTLMFSIVVNAPLAFAATQGDLSFTAGHLSEFPLPAADGGTGSRSYTLTPPSTISNSGFAFDGQNRVVRGTLTGTGGTSIEVTYTVGDSATTPASAMQVFDLVIAPAVDFGSAAVAEQSYTMNLAIAAPPVLPTNATGGVGVLDYQLTDLDGLGGVSVTESGGVYTLTGTPNSAAGVHNLVWSATDLNGAADEVTFLVTVFAAPMFATTPGNLAFPKDTARTLTLPEVEGGRPAITYRLNGLETVEVKTGLTFSISADNEPRIGGLSGEEDTVGVDVTFSATDANGVSVEAVFKVLVVERPTFMTDRVDLTYTHGNVVDYTLPEASGLGDLRYEFSFSGRRVRDLGLRLDESERVLSGTARSHSDAATITMTATDRDGEFSDPPLTVNVLVVPAPRLTGRIADQNFTQDSPITTLNFPVGADGTGARPLAYTLVPDAPAGLMFDDGVRPPTLSGTPDAVFAVDEFAFTVTDANGVTDVERFRITIDGPLAFPDMQGDLTVTAGFPVALTLPEGGGGKVPRRYELEPVSVLSGAGLNFVPGTRVLSGVPSGALAQTEMAYTVIDANDARISQNFNLTISAPIVFASGNQFAAPGAVFNTEPGQSLADAGHTVQLPNYASGGTGTVELTLIGPGAGGGLDGLGFDYSTRALTGTLSGGGGRFMWKATDDIGAFVTLDFFVTSTGPYFQGAPTVANRVYIQRRSTVYRIAGSRYEEVRGVPPLPEATRNEPAPAEVGRLTYEVVDAAGRKVRGSAGASAPYAAPGLRFSPSSRVLSGAPSFVTATGEALELTYRVLDQLGQSAELAFNATSAARLYFAFVPDDVVAPLNSELSYLDPASGDVAAGIRSPEVLGGTSSSVRIGGVLPGGLSVAGDPPTLTGTPTAEGVYSLAWIATDALVDGISVTFQLTVRNDPVFLEQAPDIGYVAGGSAIDIVLPPIHGATGTVVYRLGPDPDGSGALPSGLNFDAATRRVTGTPPTSPPANSAVRSNAAGGIGIGTRIFSSALNYVASGDNGVASQVVTIYAKAVNENEAPEFAHSRKQFGDHDEDAATPNITFVAVALGPENSSVRLNPSGYFADANGDSLVYEAVSGDQNVVRVAGGSVTTREIRSGGRLELALSAAGESADLEITATDPHGEQVTGTLRIAIHQGRGPRRVGRYADLNKVLLPGIARAITDQNVAAITRRIQKAAAGRAGSRSGRTGAPGAAYTLDGQSDLEQIAATQMQAIADGTLDLKKLLTRSSFSVPLKTMRSPVEGAGAAGFVKEPGSAVLPSSSLALTGASETGVESLTVWGAGDYRSLSSDRNVRDWDAELYAFHIGADLLVARDLLVGMAISSNQSELEYTGPSIGNPNSKITGNHELDLLTLSPYISWRPANAEWWASAGFGEGEIAIEEPGEQRATGDAKMLTLSAGVTRRRAILGGFDVVYKGEVQGSALKVADTGGGIAKAEVETSLLRVAMEVARPRLSANGVILEPNLEIGLRYDGGDGQTGDALEVGFGFAYFDPGTSLRMESRAYTLMGRAGYNEWGLRGNISYAPNATSGLSLSLAPGYGTTRTGVEQAWRDELAESEGEGEPEPTLDAKLSYAISRGRNVFRPHTGFTLGGDKNSWRTGVDWESRHFFDLGLTGERREDSHAVLLKGKLHF